MTFWRSRLRVVLVICATVAATTSWAEEFLVGVEVPLTGKLARAEQILRPEGGPQLFLPEQKGLLLARAGAINIGGHFQSVAFGKLEGIYKTLRYTLHTNDGIRQYLAVFDTLLSQHQQLHRPQHLPGGKTAIPELYQPLRLGQYPHPLKVGGIALLISNLLPIGGRLAFVIHQHNRGASICQPLRPLSFILAQFFELPLVFYKTYGKYLAANKYQ